MVQKSFCASYEGLERIFKDLRRLNTHEGLYTSGHNTQYAENTKKPRGNFRGTSLII